MKKLIYFLFISLIICSCSDSLDDENSMSDFSGESGTFIDERDGHEYKWVKIGNQIWMAENLAYLPQINKDDGEVSAEPKYYVYDYNGTSVSDAKATSNYNKYGVLYTQSAAKLSCPSGWHLATAEEWEQLASFVSNDNGGYEREGDDWREVGKHLKSSTEWNGTDDYGFNALPAGNFTQIYEYEFGGFMDKGEKAFWYTDSKDSYGNPFYLQISNTSYNYLDKGSTQGTICFSVRCIRD